MHASHQAQVVIILHRYAEPCSKPTSFSVEVWLALKKEICPLFFQKNKFE